MRRIFLSIAVVLLAVTSVHPQQTEAKPSSPTGKYQLLSAICEPEIASGQANEHCVFLLDTQTGRVWKYQSGVAVTDADGKQQYLSPTFIPIGVGLPKASPIVP
jgi:hypothetical protein